MNEENSFNRHDLGDGLELLVGSVPSHLLWNEDLFRQIWDMHPLEKHRIMMHGHWVEIPRWQEAYGKDYEFSGSTKKAQPIPAILMPLTLWAQESTDARLNGILMNYYEGQEHYIGPHHDSVRHMIKGAPIVTVSFGETRTFRLTLEGKDDKKTLVKETKDFSAPPGTVFVMPYETNLVWKHGVPKSKRFTGRRISVTFRAFK